VAAGEPLVVAFSGGPDSTALLLGLRLLAPRLACRPIAVHVDHRLDAGSGARAAAAAALAARLDTPFQLLVAPDGWPTRGESREAAARRRRYRLLAAERAARGARWVLTAHHADDQAETILLRLGHGSGLAGLAGMRARQGSLLRPLLELPRRALAAAVEAAGLQPVDDPTNRDLAVPRNRLRHRLVPALGGAAASANARALGVAAATLAVGLERRLLAVLPTLAAKGAPRIAVDELRRLPAELISWALGLLHRRAGADYPPRAAAVAELRRQLGRGGEIACDCGGGWQWRTDGDRFLVALRAPAETTDFAYTLHVPGGVEIREAGTTFRLSRQPVAAWMRLGAAGRAALDLPLEPGGQVTVRSRRPGDRLQPLGLAHHRRLKDILIDRKVPRADRDRLPLLCVAGQLAWVPGVTIHHPFRLRQGASMAWVAELEPR
jgi:tRNA(Ile)-lysidine synthase